MNFSANIRRARGELRSCLVGGKIKMLACLKNILLNARNFLKTDELDFWIHQFDILDLEEFATTAFGLSEVQSLIGMDLGETNNSRSKLLDELQTCCRYLLTYTEEGDDCPMQSQFFWFFSPSEGVTYKASELGVGGHVPPIDYSMRVAKKSELNASAHGFLR